MYMQFLCFCLAIIKIDIQIKGKQIFFESAYHSSHLHLREMKSLIYGTGRAKQWQ